MDRDRMVSAAEVMAEVATTARELRSNARRTCMDAESTRLRAWYLRRQAREYRTTRARASRTALSPG